MGGGGRKKLVFDTGPVLVPAPEGITSNQDYYLTGKIVTKQVIDPKVTASVTDYYALEYRRRSNGSRYHAPFPAGICNGAGYGAGIKAQTGP
jgi:hypothetical protein